MNIVKVTDFTDIPGSRYISDGDGSAEEFFIRFVEPEADGTLLNRQSLEIDLDGTWGYASSFISELAMRIAKKYKKYHIKKRLIIKSDDDPAQINRFWNEFSKKY